METYKLEIVQNWTAYNGDIFLEVVNGKVYTNGFRILGLNAGGGGYDKAASIIGDYIGALYGRYLSKKSALVAMGKIEKLSGYNLDFKDSYIKIKKITETKSGGYLYQVTATKKMRDLIKNRG